MLVPQLVFTLILLMVCSFAPGFLVVRRLPWSGLEKLCGSIALSLVMLYLAAWGIYLFLTPVAYYGLAAACGVAGVVVARDAWQLFRGLRVKRALAGYGLLLVWTLLVTSVIRNYSGALWGGDWLEHFQRALFFLHHFAKDTPIFREYVLPSRPPMMNVIAAFFLGVTQDRFEIFQFVFVFLNLLVFLPCCLALPLLVRVRRVKLLPLVGVFAMNPAMMENATYTWTKALTAFFVILALYLYLAAWRKRDSLRMTAAFVALSAGLLVHYSAGPYVVFFAVHYLVVVFRGRPAKWKELGAIAVTCGLLLATWFTWSMAAYGTHTTFASNTSITMAKEVEGSVVAKIGGNVMDSIVPRIAWAPEQVRLFDQPYALGAVRDNVFLFYQTNLIFSMGLIGGPLVVWSVISAFRGRKGLGGERNFWLMFIVFSVAIGLAVVGERDRFGVAHLTLIPLELLGITVVAAKFFSGQRIALLIVAGCLIDFSLGIFLHARVQHLDNTAEHTYFTGLAVGEGRFLIGAPGPDSLYRGAWRNWLDKHYIVLFKKWLATAEAYRPGDPAFESTRQDLRAAVTEQLKEDQTFWHGWYGSHGGEVELIGDHFGGGDATSVLLALAALALLWQMARQAPQVTLAAVNGAALGKPKLSRSRHKR